MILSRIYFLPPLAIARVGGSDTPLECFGQNIDGTIRPEVTLQMLPDGSLRTYRPNSILFRDNNLLRPVAPFFELWATFTDGEDKEWNKCLNLGLLNYLGISLASVEYSITVANRKAQRRTGSANCAFVAKVDANGDDYEKKRLLAFSPHNPGGEPLVYRDHPIPLGYFQVIKPIELESMGVDLSTLRVRFTPAKGQVYGPPDAIAGPASPLPPGGALPSQTLGGRQHEIVPEENRILNPCTKWSRYIMDEENQQDPQPSDSYDGANVGNNRSWGVVDDTCDGIIEARVVCAGKRQTATTRVFSCCPDYAPDRRPFFSLADDLADRDPPPDKPGPLTDEEQMEIEGEIADLFKRVFETASMVNLDATREHALGENMASSNSDDVPKTNESSMTAYDEPFARLTADTHKKPAKRYIVPLRYAADARHSHAPLADLHTLIDTLGSQADYVRKLIRPPFGRFGQLDERPDTQSRRNDSFRDPRVPRDTLHDMRMPPYMRDSDETPLSITYRQYQLLLTLLDRLAPRWRGSHMKILDELQSSDEVLVSERVDVVLPATPISRKIDRLVERLSKRPEKS
jgi:hypothetical protein